jgi:RNA polymerase sigma factor for flagellar operon FliA
MPKKSLASDDSVANLSTEETALWLAYESANEHSRSDDARNALAKFYRPQIEKQVRHYLSHRKLSVTKDDVIGAVWARILQVAIPRYNHRRGLQFVTFAETHVRGAILDVLRENDWVPRSIRVQQTVVQDAIEDLEREHSQPPTDEQIARRLHISLEKLQEILVVIRPVHISSMNTKCHPQPLDDGDLHLRDAEKSAFLVDQRELTPPQLQQRADLIDHICKSCNEVEKAVLMGLYYHGQTMQAIGESVGLSQSRISQIHTELMDRLRVTMADRQDEFVL